MASASLTNMSVAADGSPANQGLLMPKLQYRFRVIFSNFGVDKASTVLTQQVVDCSRPTVSFGEITLPIYNSTLYLAGKATWSAMSINLRDDAGGGVSKLVGQQLQKQMDFMEQASAATGQDYKFQTNIQILDGGNGTSAVGVLETWQLYGCFLVSANYNTLNYATNEAVTIGLSIRYDNAALTPDDKNVGGTFARQLGGALVSGVGAG